MKAAIIYGGRDIRVEDVPMPEPGPGEVLVKIASAGICGSDLHPYRGHNPYGVREPHQRGHELSGEIAGLGDGVTALAVGRRVGIEAEHLLGCGSCRNCKRGQYHICTTRASGMASARRATASLSTTYASPRTAIPCPTALASMRQHSSTATRAGFTR